MPTPSEIDGVTPAKPSEQTLVMPPEAAVARSKRSLLLFAFAIYAAYGMWGFLLMSLLPDPDGGKQELIEIGKMTALAGAAAFLIVGAVGVLRIRSNAQLPSSSKQRALIRSIAAVVPGLLLSAALPLMITREPPITLEISKPAPEDLIAPVAVTFDVQKAVSILQTRGQRVIKYLWDVDGDGKTDRETVTPTLTTTYQREGVFSTTVTLNFSAGGGRKLSRRVIVQKAVFTYDPQPAIVNQPVVFDAGNLVQNRADIQSIAWDFDADGTADAESKETQALTTFYKTGSYPVGLTLKLTDNTQSQYQRTVEVTEPPPLPFPAEIVTEPQNLSSPPPFQVVFSVKTEEPLSQVQWNFGDGGKAEGMRTAHTFTKRGEFVVVAKARSATGSVANLATTVFIADPLPISDLLFKGSPLPNGDTITGEVPLTVSLDPQTSMQFVTFEWEAPGASETGSTEGKLQAIYREADTYYVTLIAHDPEDRVFRKKFKVEAKPITALIKFNMEPLEGVAPLKVRFDASETDIPGEVISGFEWDFGDGSPRIPGGASIEHVFTEARSYQVTLRVKTISGQNEGTANRNILVRVPPLKACVLASRTRGPAPLYIKFDSGCTEGEAAKFEWDFKDGGTSTERHPVYKFESAGVYQVQLTVTDAAGRKSTAPVTITAE